MLRLRCVRGIAARLVTTPRLPTAVGGSSSVTHEPPEVVTVTSALVISTKSIEPFNATVSVTPKRSSSRVERGSPARVFLAPVASAAAVPASSSSEQGLGLSVLGFRMASPLPPIQPPVASPIHARKQAVSVPSYRSFARARPAKPLSSTTVNTELLQAQRAAAAITIQRFVCCPYFDVITGTCAVIPLS